MSKTFCFLLCISTAVLPVAFFCSYSVASKTHKLENETYEKYMPLLVGSDEFIRHKYYSIAYADDFEQARWVYYMLNKHRLIVNRIKRTGRFRCDPLVTCGSAMSEDYKKTGFDRGHLCPAADMSFDIAAMDESFFMSNMSPQQPSFNRGIWKRLEEKVREWASTKDTLYIVTAGILFPGLRCLNNRNVAIPEMYYKVILDPGVQNPSMAAFLIPNCGSSKELISYAVPPDAIEELTGIDFFAALPDSLEKVLEARIDTAAWFATQ